MSLGAAKKDKKRKEYDKIAELLLSDYYRLVILEQK
jgi:hypothetical protein